MNNMKKFNNLCLQLLIDSLYDVPESLIKE